MFFRPKVASSDFQESSLPQNRKEIFFDVVKLQWPKLLVLGGITLLFSLPLIGTSILRSTVQNQLYSAAVAGEAAAEEAMLQIAMMTTVLDGVDILLYGLLAIGLAAVAHIIKKLAWEENVELSKALLDGTRQNGKQYLLLGLLIGAGIFIIRYAMTTGQGIGSYLTALIGALIFAPVVSCMTVTITIYDVPFTQQFRYSLLTCGKNVLSVLGALALCSLPFVAEAVVNGLLGTAASVVAAIIVRLISPLCALAWFLSVFSWLDKVINEKYYPELVGRGLDLVRYEDEMSWLD